MPIIDNGVTDNVENAKKGVQQGVHFLIEREMVNFLKFGITNQPQTQLKQFERDGLRYNYLFLIYKATSSANVKMMKDYIVSTYPEYCDKEMRNHGENYGDPPYFLYCAIYIPPKKL